MISRMSSTGPQAGLYNQVGTKTWVSKTKIIHAHQVLLTMRVNYFPQLKIAFVVKDIHRCHAGKVECLKCHLGSWFPDALCPYSAHRGTRLDARPHVLGSAHAQKLSQLGARDALKLVQDCGERQRDNDAINIP